MKVSQLALAGVLLAALSCSTFAQQGMYGPMSAGPEAYAGNPQAMGYGQQAMGPQGGYYPQALPSQMGYAQQTGYPQQMPSQMGYPQQAMPAGYPMQGMGQGDAQQALYGPSGPMSGGPMPMNGDGGGMGCGPDCGGGCGPNQAHCYDDGITHYAYGSVDVFYARRDNSVLKQTVALDTNTGGTAISTSDTEFRFLPGIKAQAGYMFGNGLGVETDFWGQWAFAGRKSFSGDNNLALPGNLGLASLNFFDTDQVQATYSSHINNYEINMVIPYASVQYLVGFRYLTVDERYDLSTFDSDTGSGDYQVITRNRLYGGQLGARTQWQLGVFVFDFEGKAGVFANAAHQDQNAVDANGFSLRSANGGEMQPAFVGEVSSYLFLPMGSHFTARLGYTGVWIDELALAPDQIDFSDTATSGSGIYARRGMLIHGFNAGLEARW